MGVYEAIAALPPGKRLLYQGAGGTTVVIDVDVTTSGAVYAVVRTQTPDDTGQPRVSGRGYAISARADCHLLEQALRDLGIDPDSYRVI